MFISLLQKRRSIRRFKDQPVEKEKVDVLVEAALRAPSSRGVNPWEFVVISDRSMLEGLAKAKEHGSSFLKDAPLGIVVCADSKKSDVWVEDASIATIIIQLAAASLDLGSCWIQVRERPHSRDRSAQEYVAELLRLPQTLMVESMVAVGYPAETKPPHKQEELLWQQVHNGTFGTPYPKGSA
ncbi:MAG: nitroreductase family protein [Hyphomicrobiales bacterium]